MPAKKKPAPTEVYQLKITLRGSRPPIWRRIQVRGDITLAELHDILQDVIGWTDSHLHQFIIGGMYYGVPDPDFDNDIVNEMKAKLAHVAGRVKSKFVYEYDFGDGWDHEILVEKILPPEPGARNPLCLAGARNCPPEDCGGIYGYEDLLKTISDPKHPDHENMLEWLGENFDPEDFDVDEVNRSLSVYQK
jgi:hypothetical protein